MNREKERHISELRSKTPPVNTNYDFGLSEININPKKRSTHYDSSPKNNKKSKTSMKTSPKKMTNDILFESYKSLNKNLKNEFK